MGIAESNPLKGCLSSKPKRKRSDEDSPVLIVFLILSIYIHIPGKYNN